jgi:HAD superfamily hydrolase (TIGR01509 family)
MSGGGITVSQNNHAIKAIVFDFDGLILDTEQPEFLSWKAMYEAHGATLALSEWLAVVGASLKEFDPLLNLQARVKHPIDVEKVSADRKRIFDEYIQAITLLPGVLDYLQAAKAMELKLAIASSSRVEWVAHYLDRFDIRHYFDALCFGNEVEKVKPDPALYALAVRRLGVSPSETVALEDSYNGLLAAKRAGLYCVCVPNPITRGLDFSLADHKLSALTDLPLKDLLHTLNGAKTG